MKRVLIISQTFPPQADVGGLRPAMFAKYLPRFGWEPLVLTCTPPSNDPSFHPTMDIEGLPPESQVVRVLYGAKDEQAALKARTFLGQVRHFFRPEEASPMGLCEKMLSSWSSVLDSREFDVVWATSPLLFPIRVATEIATARRVPWVADFRDLFDQFAGLDISLRGVLLRMRLRWRQRQLLKTASTIITVSKHMADMLSGQTGIPAEVIPNGYDPEMFRGNEQRNTPCFSITYAGRILGAWLQDPRVFFSAMDRLLGNGDITDSEVVIRFYGTDSSVLDSLLSPFKCKRIVRIERRVAYSEVPRVLQKSTILLVLTNRNRRGILTTKAFEYLAARRPILCVPGDRDALDELLMETNAGISCPDVESTAQALLQWFSEWKRTGIVRSQGREEVISL